MVMSMILSLILSILNLILYFITGKEILGIMYGIMSCTSLIVFSIYDAVKMLKRLV